MRRGPRYAIASIKKAIKNRPLGLFHEWLFQATPDISGVVFIESSRKIHSKKLLAFFCPEAYCPERATPPQRGAPI